MPKDVLGPTPPHPAVPGPNPTSHNIEIYYSKNAQPFWGGEPANSLQLQLQPQLQQQLPLPLHYTTPHFASSTVLTNATTTATATATTTTTTTVHYHYNYHYHYHYTTTTPTSCTAQGGGGSFIKRKPIGEIGCCESRMAERIH